MTDPAALLALAAVVEGGIAPDREIDALVWVALHEGLSVVTAWYGPAYVKGPDESTNVPEPLTASVDAALSLLREVLPKCGLTTDFSPVDENGRTISELKSDGLWRVEVWHWSPSIRAEGRATSLGRAIVAAVLRAAATITTQEK